MCSSKTGCLLICLLVLFVHIYEGMCALFFHASHSRTEWDEGYVWMASSLFKCDSLFPLSGGRQITTPCFCQSSLQPRGGTVCLHHRGLLSTAVLLFQTLFIDYEKREVFHISLSPSLILFLSLVGLIKLSYARLYLLPAYSSLQCNNYQNGCISYTNTTQWEATGGALMSLVINKQNQSV